MNLIYIIGTIIIVIIIFVLFTLSPPSKDEKIHHFSDAAIKEGQKQYERVLRLNENFEDKEILEKYAVLVRESVQTVGMYMATTEIKDPYELDRQANYWMVWSKYYMNKYKKLEQKHNFVLNDGEGE